MWRRPSVKVPLLALARRLFSIVGSALLLSAPVLVFAVAKTSKSGRLGSVLVRKHLGQGAEAVAARRAIIDDDAETGAVKPVPRPTSIVGRRRGEAAVVTVRGSIHPTALRAPARPHPEPPENTWAAVALRLGLGCSRNSGG